MRTSLVATAVAFALGAGSLAADPAHAAPHHHRAAKAAAAAPAPDVAAELASRDREIAALKDAVSKLSEKVDELETRNDAQSVVNVNTAKDVESLQVTAKKTEKLDKLVNDTSVGGKVFLDISQLDQKKNGVRTANQGVGFDVKRGYLIVNHAFNDTWSANLTTDFNYVALDGETQLFVKNLYLQGKFSDAFVFRAGAAPMPWIPYAEGFYGYRYVDKLIVDRLSFGTTADWGLNANGKLADGRVDYSVSAVNGGGFRNPTRTKRMDVEGRVGFSPIANTVIAIGGYSGTLGKETETTKALHTADRGDAMIAYAKGNNRLGAEYFTARNWTTVLSPLEDKATGYSFWGSYGFTDKFSVFGRYDRAHPSKDLDKALTDRFWNAGVQWDVRKGLKVAAVYKNEDLRDNANDTKTEEFGIFGEVTF